MIQVRGSPYGIFCGRARAPVWGKSWRRSRPRELSGKPRPRLPARPQQGTPHGLFYPEHLRAALRRRVGHARNGIVAREQAYLAVSTPTGTVSGSLGTQRGLQAPAPGIVQVNCRLYHCLYDHTPLEWDDLLRIGHIWVNIQVWYQHTSYVVE
jgi:hypothetical protein